MASAPLIPNAQAEALVQSYERAGYKRAAPPILQPAEPFLDLSGEDIRKRMFLTTDAEGRELCLRPDLTIPVSLAYLASPRAGKPQGYCYLGTVFRHRRPDVSASGRREGNGTRPPAPASGEAPEFLQAGIESFGRPDTAAADAEMISLGLDATAHHGLGRPDILMGDVGLFAALVAALDLAPAWKRRLIKDFNQKTSLAHDLDRLTISISRAQPEYQGVLAALAGSDPKAAHALVTDLLSIAGISAVGGRSVGEIADRFLDQAALTARPSLPQEIRTLIECFLAIAGDPHDAAGKLRAFAKGAALRLDPALDLFESRAGFLASRGIDVSRIRFATAFGRGLDYYTGVVFELHDPSGQVEGPLVAGGRYDGLLARLGSNGPIPAVGFAVWIERLATCGSAR
ncbi:MAG TPA: ATP phosphoribosyltransferase regulatory subunit [Xanthobacteraceae bacterium]|jgi:ATP phosphoribosyltransferase regulatory subunit